MKIVVQVRSCCLFRGVHLASLPA